MKHFFILLMTAGACLLQGQNYKAIDAQRAYIFSYNHIGANYDVAGFKVESTSFGNAIDVHHFNTTYERNSYLCYSPSSIWIGRAYASEIVAGQDFFYNKQSQPILLKRKARLNDEWICYNSGRVQVIAKVTQLAYENHMEGYDSIKTVSFQVYDVTGIPLDYQLNGMSIKIGKNKGLVQTINFNEFPGNLSSQLGVLNTYTILGATNPDAGVRPLSKSSIYDFGISDEIHTQEVKYALPAVGSYYDTINTIAKVINKTETLDSITLYFKEQSQYIKASVDIGGSQHVTSYGTGYTQLKFSKTDLLLPGSGRVEQGRLLFYTQNYANGSSKLIETSPGHGSIASEGTDFCIEHFFCETSDQVNYYQEGLGGPYFNLPRCYINYWGWNKRLVYAKKNTSAETGTPFEFGDVITGLEEFANEPTFKISPNPFSDELVVSNTEPLSAFDINDLHGHLLFHKELLPLGAHLINTSTLAKGMYVVSWTDNKGLMNHRKLIKN